MIDIFYFDCLYIYICTVCVDIPYFAMFSAAATSLIY